MQLALQAPQQSSRSIWISTSVLYVASRAVSRASHHRRSAPAAFSSGLTGSGISGRSDFIFVHDQHTPSTSTDTEGAAHPILTEPLDLDWTKGTIPLSAIKLVIRLQARILGPVGSSCTSNTGFGPVLTYDQRNYRRSGLCRLEFSFYLYDLWRIC